MQDAFSVILEQIERSVDIPLLIAIDGRCAAGKTTLAARLQERTGCNVVHMDHFFLRPWQRTEERMQEPGGNVDYERVREEVMLPLRRGGSFSYRVYDCKKKEFLSRVAVEPAALTIVEGSYSCHPLLWDFYDFRVFLDVEKEEQLRRIETRNQGEAAFKFRDCWIPLEERYFNAYRIAQRCDFVF